MDEWGRWTSAAVLIIPNGVVLGLIVLAVLTAVGTVSVRDAVSLVILVIGAVLMFFGITIWRKRHQVAEASMEWHPQDVVPQVGCFRDLAIVLIVGAIVAWYIAIRSLL